MLRIATNQRLASSRLVISDDFGDHAAQLIEAQIAVLLRWRTDADSAISASDTLYNGEVGR